MGPAPRGSRQPARGRRPAAEPPPGSGRCELGGWGRVNLCPLSIGLPSLGGARGSAPESGGRWRRLARSPALCEKRRREMAEVGSREQFGALRKVLQPGEAAMCLPVAGGPHVGRVLPGAAATLRALGKGSKGQRGGQGGRAEGVQKTHFARRLYWGCGAKGLGSEVTWIQLNSCTCLALTFESSPRCPAFIPGSRDMSATG